MTAVVDQITISLSGDVSIRQVEYTSVFGNPTANFHREARPLTADTSDLPPNFKAAIDAYKANALTADQQAALASSTQGSQG